MNKATLLATTMIVAQSAFGAWFSGEEDALTRAHESFLKKDYAEMAQSLKRVFLDPKSDDVARRNALSLLDKAYEVTSGKIPVDWKLPEGIDSLKVTLRFMRGPNKDGYALKISGTEKTRGLVKQVQVIQYPDRVVLDKANKIGDWTENLESDDDGFYFEVDGPRADKPAADGLYLLNLELTSGKTTKGWFLLSDLVSSDTPVVQAPSVGQTISTRTPTLRWSDFRSPEYKPHEGRSLWLAVVKAGDVWKEDWTIDESDPITTEATVGVDPKGEGVSKLEDGSYQLYLAYKEKRRFGDLKLARQSLTRVPFHVRGK